MRLLALPQARLPQAQENLPDAVVGIDPNTGLIRASITPQDFHSAFRQYPVSGYSGTPLPKKLGVKAGQRAHVGAAAPPAFLDEVEDVTWVRQPRPPVDLAVVFTTSVADYRRRLATMGRALVADLTEDVVRDIAVAETTLVDTKVCAIDDTWSGLRLVVRVSDRPSWPVQRTS